MSAAVREQAGLLGTYALLRGSLAATTSSHVVLRTHILDFADHPGALPDPWTEVRAAVQAVARAEGGTPGALAARTALLAARTRARCLASVPHRHPVSLRPGERSGDVSGPRSGPRPAGAVA